MLGSHPGHPATIQQPVVGRRRLSIRSCSACSKLGPHGIVDFSPSTNRGGRAHKITRADLRLPEEDIADFERVLGGIRMALGPTKRTAKFLRRLQNALV